MWISTDQKNHKQRRVFIRRKKGIFAPLLSFISLRLSLSLSFFLLSLSPSPTSTLGRTSSPGRATDTLRYSDSPRAMPPPLSSLFNRLQKCRGLKNFLREAFPLSLSIALPLSPFRTRTKTSPSPHAIPSPYYTIYHLYIAVVGCLLFI